MVSQKADKNHVSIYQLLTQVYNTQPQFNLKIGVQKNPFSYN